MQLSRCDDDEKSAFHGPFLRLKREASRRTLSHWAISAGQKVSHAARKTRDSQLLRLPAGYICDVCSDTLQTDAADFFTRWRSGELALGAGDGVAPGFYRCLRPEPGASRGRASGDHAGPAHLTRLRIVPASSQPSRGRARARARIIPYGTVGSNETGKSRARGPAELRAKIRPSAAVTAVPAPVLKRGFFPEDPWRPA